MGKLWGAIGLAAVSLFMLLGFLQADVSGLPAVLTFLLTVGVPAGGAVALFRVHRGEHALKRGDVATLRRQTQEADVLRLAQRRGGRLTVVEVMTELALDQSTADALLKSLHTQDLAEIEITESGGIVYAFPDVLRLPEKHSGKGLLDA